MPSGTVDRCDLFFDVACVAIACEQQTHFRSSLLSLRKFFFGGREATTENASAVRRLA